MKKVTGLGGIFFKCEDPKKMKEWYATNLGLPVTDYGAKFEWRELDNPDKIGATAWSTSPKDTKSFAPSEKDFMINYRVADIAGLVEELRNAGVTIVDEIVSYGGFGKFVHILDPEGNKVELWEPADDTDETAASE